MSSGFNIDPTNEQVMTNALKHALNILPENCNEAK